MVDDSHDSRQLSKSVDGGDYKPLEDGVPQMGDDEIIPQSATTDVEMMEPPKPDWHLAEATAHPEAIAEYINSDTSPPYFLRLGGKELEGLSP